MLCYATRKKRRQGSKFLFTNRWYVITHMYMSVASQVLFNSIIVSHWNRETVPLLIRVSSLCALWSQSRLWIPSNSLLYYVIDLTSEWDMFPVRQELMSEGVWRDGLSRLVMLTTMILSRPEAIDGKLVITYATILGNKQSILIDLTFLSNGWKNTILVVAMTYCMIVSQGITLFLSNEAQSRYIVPHFVN